MTARKTRKTTANLQIYDRCYNIDGCSITVSVFKSLLTHKIKLFVDVRVQNVLVDWGAYLSPREADRFVGELASALGYDVVGSPSHPRSVVQVHVRGGHIGLRYDRSGKHGSSVVFFPNTWAQDLLVHLAEHLDWDLETDT